MCIHFTRPVLLQSLPLLPASFPSLPPSFPPVLRLSKGSVWALMVSMWTQRSLTTAHSSWRATLSWVCFRVLHVRSQVELGEWDVSWLWKHPHVFTSVSAGAPAVCDIHWTVMESTASVGALKSIIINIQYVDWFLNMVMMKKNPQLNRNYSHF